MTTAIHNEQRKREPEAMWLSLQFDPSKSNYHHQTEFVRGISSKLPLEGLVAPDYALHVIHSMMLGLARHKLSKERERKAWHKHYRAILDGLKTYGFILLCSTGLLWKVIRG